jgi:hypothetical protein
MQTLAGVWLDNANYRPHWHYGNYGVIVKHLIYLTPLQRTTTLKTFWIIFREYITFPYFLGRLLALQSLQIKQLINVDEYASCNMLNIYMIEFPFLEI